MEDRRSIAKKAAIGVALVIAAAGAVLSVSYTHLTLPTKLEV